MLLKRSAALLAAASQARLDLSRTDIDFFTFTC
jgi:hypothetical protein